MADSPDKISAEPAANHQHQDPIKVSADDADVALAAMGYKPVSDADRHLAFFRRRGHSTIHPV